MKYYHKPIIAITFIVFQLSCNNANNAESIQDLNKSLADSAKVNYATSSAAVETNKDSERKFIRTAELKFKVKDVVTSTYDIEDITNRHGGFVTFTDLRSENQNIVTTPVSADSSLETIYYEVVNTITLRVPNTKLDTVLKDISHNIGYLDHRIIQAKDVALQMIANDLSEKRNNNNAVRLVNAIDTRSKKLAEITEAEEIVSDKKEQSDDAKLSTLSLKDQVKFSTVSLFLYQRPAIKKEMIANDKPVVAYEPGLGSKLIGSLKYGWEMLSTLIVFLTKLWWVILIGGIGYVVYRKYYRTSGK